MSVLPQPRCSLTTGLAALSFSLAIGQIPSYAMAQQATRMEEIIVTARKREEDMQKVPISINAFTEQALREFNAFALEGIAELTPGMQFRQLGGISEVVMRGLAQTDQRGIQSNVGVFIDGIFLNNRSSIEFNNMDLARIEVLKGPQSALFGRNTFAGAINYVSNGAQLGEFDATIDLELGSNDRRGARGSVNLPIGDHAAVRLFGGTSKFDGTINNVRGDDNIGGWNDRTTLGFSGLLEYERVRLKVFYTRNEVEDDTPALRLLSFELNDGGSEYLVPDGMGGTRSVFTILTGRLSAPREVSLDPRARGNKGKYWLAYGNLDVDLNLATLTLNVSRSESEYSSFFDNIGDPDAVNRPFFGIYTAQFLTDSTGDLGKQDTVDLRLTSSTEAPFQWMLGYSYFDSTSGNVLGTTTPLLADPDTLARITNVEKRLLQRVDAFYGSVNYPLTNQLNLTAELRYTREDQALTDRAEIFFLPVLSRPLTSTETDFDYWSGRIGVDYLVADNTMVYAYAAQGIKSGGINAVPEGNPFFTFDPEKNWTYELGVKTDVLGGRGVLNAAVDYIDWTDLQSTAPASLAAGSVTANGSGAKSKGIELDGSWFVTDNFTLRLAATYIDARYNSDFVDAAVEARCGVNSSPLTPVSTCSAAVGGNQIANTSDVQFFGTGVYTFPSLVGSFDGFLRASYSYEAGRYPESLNLAKSESVNLVNFRAGLRNDSTEIAFWMDNAFGEESLARATRQTDTAANSVCLNCGVSSTALVRANGRTWGVRVVHSF
ncbi:MAG: TonB-dependent receptor [Gammaproteobacteria bacterium]|nr:TonB-dependent receptor [Gammaproteobacteria bacterium]